jgi:hypothetical protein
MLYTWREWEIHTTVWEEYFKGRHHSGVVYMAERITLSRVCVTIDGVWIGEWIYWPLIHTTRNYKQLQHRRYLHNSEITTAPAKPFPACCVFTSRSLATASNSRDSSALCALVFKYEAYPQNKFRLQILSLQRCGHNGANLCSLLVLWEGTDTICRQSNCVYASSCVYNVQENWEARQMWNVVCNPFLECKKHETGWHLSTLWGVNRTCHEWFNGTKMGETLYWRTRKCVW